MNRGSFQPRSAVIIGAAIVAASLAGVMSGTAAHASDDPGFSIANVGPYGGEPSILSDGKGVLYDSTPSGGLLVYRSTDRGVTWTPATTPDPNSGDTCLATDQSNAVYACNLAGSQGSVSLQADVWKCTNRGYKWEPA
jgi:hypothetical protein